MILIHPLRLFRLFLKKVIMLSTKELETGPHITRYYMYQHLRSVLKSLNRDNRSSRVLSISQSNRLCNLLNAENLEITEANFPECNILKLPFPDGHFDYVASDQVLEHVEGNPQQAIDETHRVLKPGGIAIHTTCLINPIHELPKDFWRFTPDALALLCSKFSKVIDVGGWGNWWVWFMSWLDLKFYPIPHARWHPLHKIAIKNNKRWSVVTWIVAQK